MLTRSLDKTKQELDDNIYTASDIVNTLEIQIDKEIKKKQDTKNTEKKLAQAKKKLADAEKAQQDYNTSSKREADANSQKLEKTHTEKELGVQKKETSHATGVDNSGTKPGKQRIFSIRSSAS
jgi:hypothetical protein